MHIGNNVGIGARCVISATRARFVCKDNCAIAEDFTVHTGNHARVIGRFVTDIGDEEKPGEYDKEVTVEEDVWIGCRVTLLSGVTVGRGSTVAAGAVVTKPLPPYCVAGGVPAKVIRFKWTVDEILRHEGMLYPEEERLSRAELEDIFNKYSKKE